MEDHFWFSFFHEAAHILLHGKTEIFIDNNENTNSKKEIEANNFASNILIPSMQLAVFIKNERISNSTVLEFAKEIDLSPGILVSRLQHDEEIPYHWLNKLKKKFEFSTVIPIG
jgi:Zn-dependent peptidase ImmA (M78 family)